MLAWTSKRRSREWPLCHRTLKRQGCKYISVLFSIVFVLHVIFGLADEFHTEPRGQHSKLTVCRWPISADLLDGNAPWPT